MAGYSPMIFDFDNDGWKDIFMTRGHVQSPLAAPRIKVDQPNTVFHNLGSSLQFAAYTSEAGLAAQPPRRHRGSAAGDLNGDGRIDVVVTALDAPGEIWINESPGAAHWLDLALEGVKSNRDGIGARIRCLLEAPLSTIMSPPPSVMRPPARARFTLALAPAVRRMSWKFAGPRE